MRRSRHARETAAYAEARRVILGRAGGLCERCGRRLDDWAAHHRRARSSGRDDSPANLACLCHPCHAWCHANVTEARHAGLIVPSWADPYTTAVKLRTGWWLLRADGSRVPLATDWLPGDTGCTAEPSEGNA